VRFLNLPGAPVLLERVGGHTDPAADLRTVCVQAVVESLADDIGRVIIVAAGDHTAGWSADLDYPLRRLVGGRSTAGQALPLSLAVGRQLIGDRLAGRELIMRTVSSTAVTETVHPADDDALIVAMADGSALGRTGGPDVVHPRAATYDHSVVEAWQSGEPTELAALDTDLGSAVMATGAPVWSHLAQLAGGRSYRSKINYADSPFGTFYLVARWS
jgi:hypothetical protein